MKDDQAIKTLMNSGLCPSIALDGIVYQEACIAYNRVIELAKIGAALLRMPELIEGPMESLAEEAVLHIRRSYQNNQPEYIYSVWRGEGDDMEDICKSGIDASNPLAVLNSALDFTKEEFEQKYPGVPYDFNYLEPEGFCAYCDAAYFADGRNKFPHPVREFVFCSERCIQEYDATR